MGEKRIKMNTNSIIGKIYAMVCGVGSSIGITALLQMSHNTTYQEWVDLAMPFMLLTTLGFVIYFWFVYEQREAI